MDVNVGVIGAGSWGTALAAILAQNGHSVLLWAREPEVAEGINHKHKNPFYIPSVTLPSPLRASADIQEVLSGARHRTVPGTGAVIVNAVPSHFVREVWGPVANLISPKTLIVNATKGLEEKTHLRMSQVLAECLPQISPEQIMTLSGPSFAEEVALGLPATVVVAGTRTHHTTTIQKLFRNDHFMTYVSEDLVGVEIGGSVKNVIAIGCGICDGMELGANTRAALMTRGLYEIAKLGKALGANPLTFAGLTGLGDLILTCTGDLSRNRTVGVALGQGKKLATILQTMNQVAEGIRTAKSVYEMMREQQITAPVCTEIYRILYEDKEPKVALKDLLKMELKAELGGLL